MNLIEVLKGVWRKMVSPKTVSNVLHITPTISDTMKQSIELWEQMYTDNSPWLSENVKSLGLAAMIASEKARTATIEMDIKITGDNARADFIDRQFNKVRHSIRENLEYGIALGGLIIKPYVKKGIDGKYCIEFNYTKATDFYPLSYSPEGDITEAAFIDRIITKAYVFSKVEYYKLEGSDLIIKNMAFKKDASNMNSGINNLNEDLGEPVPLTSISTWSEISPEVLVQGAGTMMFAYFKMPQANNVDLSSPLGVSGFSRAVDLIKDADEQYSNLLWEFEGGQLAIDVDRTALLPTIDNGKKVEVLPKLQDRLYRRSLDLGDDYSYNVFSPTLRDKSILNGLNNILMHIEDVCALSRGTLSVVTYAEARTATELKILKQRSFADNADIQKALENTLKDILVIMDKYCDLYELCEPGDFEVAYKWDDSIIIDKDAERQVDIIDVQSGLMSRVEYRMKWYGETETQAEDVLKTIDKEKEDALMLQQKTAMAAQGVPSNKQTPNERASQSREVLQKKSED